MDAGGKKTYDYLIGIDVARGFAAFSVFVYHYGIGNVLAKETGFAAFNLLSLLGSTYAVPLFFIVSGYCIHRSHIGSNGQDKGFSLSQYAWRRFWRIYPAYFVAVLFSCAVMAMESQHVDPWDFLVHLTLLQAFSTPFFNSLNLVLWTISVEACFYLLYPVWRSLRIHLGLCGAMTFGFLVSAACWTASWLYMFPYDNPTRWFVLNLWGAWLAGAALAEPWARNPNAFTRGLWWASGFAYLSAIILLCLTGCFSERGEIFWQSAITIAWLWPVSALIMMERLFHKGPTFVRWPLSALALCGQFSYSLYLFHMPMIYFRNVLWSDGQRGPLRFVLWATGFVIILAMCWLAYQVFERPFLRYRLVSSRTKLDSIALPIIGGQSVLLLAKPATPISAS